VRSHPTIVGESERERDERWLAGHLTSPLRTPDASARAAARIDELVDARGLTGDPRIPVGLVARVRAGHTPLVHHVLALHELTQVGVYECLRIFGYDLEDLPLLQAVLHRDRTVILPATTSDHGQRTTWPAALDEHADLARGEFLPEIVSRFESRVPADVADPSASRFLYLRVGRFDTGLIPILVPGTIVQVDTFDRGPTRFTSRGLRGDRRPLYAVAHLRGLTCAYVDWLDDRTIALVSIHHHEPPLIYRLDDEAVVLGRVCADLRPMEVRAEDVSKRGHDHCASRLLRPDPERQTFGAFLRASREAIGMTHRDAHAVSLRIADAYRDPRFAVGVGTLSDWESQSALPLHVPHVISLAVCYGVSFTDLLRASRLLGRDSVQPERHHAAPYDNAALETPVAPALLHAVRIAADLPDLSWDDVFRCGDEATVFDRALLGARYLIVNRRSRSLARKGTIPTIDRPLYVVSDECGRQFCSGCFVDRDRFYIQPDPHLPLSMRAVPRRCVTIRGRIVAALRRR
jgi:hypothetical protein